MRHQGHQPNAASDNHVGPVSDHQSSASPVSTQNHAVNLTQGVVTWSIDGVTVPCIIRDGKPHGPVRILETQLLNALSSTAAVNAAFQSRRLLVSKYLTDVEALRLTYATGRRFGAFTSQDLVVDIDDFRELHAYLKATLQSHNSTRVTGGWVQVNNSVIPYLSMSERKLLPLPVVINAAGLLSDVPVGTLSLQYPTDAQCQYLNELCAGAGLQFTFRTSTALLDLDTVRALTQPTPYTRELPPGKDPFLHAHFIDDSLLAAVASSASRLPATTAAFQQQSQSAWNTTTTSRLDAVSQHSPGGLSSLPAATSQVLPQAIITASHQPLTPAQTLTVIEPVSFRGRTISSLRRPADSNHYILLDAVCRVFFPQQRNVDGFIRAIETLFHIPDVRMTEAEQQHFISFYRLPTDRLTYSKLIRFDLLTEIFPNLERLFLAEVRGVDDGQLIGTVIPRPPPATTPHHEHTAAETPCVTTTTTSTTTNNNNNNNNTDRRRKRRRKDICTDVVVID